MTDARAGEVLDFWFGDALESQDALQRQYKRWFRRDDDFDAEIASRFGALPDLALAGDLDEWRNLASSALALVLVLDQFPRNLFRDSPRAFAYDEAGRSVAEDALARGFDDALHPVQSAFLYLPFQHAEDAALQERCVSLYRRLRERTPAALREHMAGYLDYAERHRDVIARFGRFPHRNAVLDRPSTVEERAYLEGGGETFGSAPRAHS